jgi:acetylornithine/N-succinyldiaminopimelate aminotransferase
MTLETKDVLAAGFERGILLGMSGEHILRLLPPFIVQEAEIDQAVSMLDDIFANA